MLLGNAFFKIGNFLVLPKTYGNFLLFQNMLFFISKNTRDPFPHSKLNL